MTRFPKLLLASAFLLSAPISAFSQTWKSLPSMNSVRFEASAVQYNDDIFVFNGFKQGIKIEPSVEVFDAGSKKWSKVGSTSVSQGNAVTHNGLVRTGNEAWLIGGRVGNHPGRVSSDVWIFNLNSKKWTRGPKLPVPGAAGGAALVNNKIHWFGGTDANARCDVANHFVFDLNQRSAGWKNITNVAGMPNARNHFSTAVHNGIIYAIGGQYGHDNCPGKRAADVNLVHAFNPANNKWTAKARIPTAQSHTEASTFVYKNAIYVVGGEVNGNKIFRFDPRKNKWDTVLQLPSLLVAPVARVIDNQLVVSSGGSPNFRFPTKLTLTTPMQPLVLGGNNEPDVVIEEPDVVIEEPEVVIEPPVVVMDEPVVVVEAPVTPMPSQRHVISLEAEYFDTIHNTSTHSWITNNLSGSSNNASIISTPDSGDNLNGTTSSPSVGYYAYFANPGIWYVWIRGWGDTVSGEGKSDSVHAGLNGSLSSTADKIHRFPASWNWSNATRDGSRATLAIPSAGIHSVNLWMREDGLAVDKIILTNDPAYQPGGTGPVHYNGASSDDGAYDSIPCIDTDGDGWGWQEAEGVPGRSCKMPVSTPTTSVLPQGSVYDGIACVDSDGDGWGWQQPSGYEGRSCKI